MMIKKPQPDEPAEAVRRRGMVRLAGVSVGIAVLSVGGTAGVAVALPAAHHTTGTASASASKKSSASPAKSAAPTKTSSPAAATSGGS